MIGWRKMLDKYRLGFDWFIAPFAGKIHVKPNILTWISLPFALTAGFSFFYSFSYHYLLIVSGLLVAGNGLFDALDGKVARIQDRVSRQGDFLDHVLDRYSDIFIVGGIALSGWCDTRIGLLALVGVLLTSYLGTQAQAVGLKRKYGGVLTRADRLTILIIAPFIQLVLLSLDLSHPLNHSFLEWVMILFAILGNATALQRFFSLSRLLQKEEN
jgi:archaetidylinositol phosphate synthase